VRYAPRRTARVLRVAKNPPLPPAVAPELPPLASEASGGEGRGDFIMEARFARHMLRQRRRREAMLGKELFADPAWDMLLDLFAAEVEGRRVSKSSLVIAASVPQSTALRWMSDLVNAGQLERYPDTADGRRTFISLTETSFQNIGRLLRICIADSKAFAAQF